MLIAYLLLNYDVKAQEKRPDPRCIGRAIIPPTDAKMEVKRKGGIGTSS